MGSKYRKCPLVDKRCKWKQGFWLRHWNNALETVTPRQGLGSGRLLYVSETGNWWNLSRCTLTVPAKLQNLGALLYKPMSRKCIGRPVPSRVSAARYNSKTLGLP